MQLPVEISQVFTTPAESLEIAIPSLTCSLTDSIEAKVGVGPGLTVTLSDDAVPICQNLTDSSQDAEMIEEGEVNAREVMLSVWPVNVSRR